MRVIHTIGEMRAACGALGRVALVDQHNPTPSCLGRLGLVPTMGFLHAGHMSLVALAKAECGAVAVSIFVNPTQFGPAEDLARYPRDMAGDLALLEAAGVDLVFTPEPAAIYPPGHASRILVGPVAEPLEGARRPDHFAGVATVVAKLFNIAAPTRAYFGQKDAQQVAVIRRMAADLDMPVAIVVGPTVREPDGLALSSRNIYLAPEERIAAAVLFRALEAARGLFAQGARDAEGLRRRLLEVLAGEPRAAVDYVSVADPDSLREIDRIEAGALVSLAVLIGRTRLIDNVVLDVPVATEASALG